MPQEAQDLRPGPMHLSLMLALCRFERFNVPEAK
jgi:hypothetical protein